MRKRFARLKALILGLVVAEDAFGLRERRPLKLNVERIEMPQIRKEHWQRFLAYARERTTLTEESGVDPKSLKAVQHEFDQDRVDAIDMEKLKWPILVSQDGYVLDGNHRWIKAYQVDHPLKLLRLGLDRDDALTLMREFPQAQFVENSFCPTGSGGGVDPSCSSGGVPSVVKKEAQFISGFPGVGKYFTVHLVGSWAKQTADKLPDRKGSNTSDFDIILTPKPSEAKGLVKFKERDEREGIIQAIRVAWKFPRSLQIHEGDVQPTSKSLTLNRFQFHSSPDKVAEFQKWLRQQFKAVLLGKSDEELWAEFARKGFERGAGRAFDDVNKTKRWLPGQGDFYGGTRKEFLRSSFGRPETTDKLKLLAGRSFTDLKNVTEDMATRMSRTLMDGLARGSNPRDLVDDLVEDLGVSEVRAEAIARTEIIRAHAEGQLDAMEKLGVEEVGVAVEWGTAKDGRVCRHCQPLQGVVLTIEEAHGTIPAHVNCRCAFVPANVGEDDSKQIRSKAAILEAFEESEVDPPELDDERPKPLVESANKVQNSDLAEFSQLMKGLT